MKVVLVHDENKTVLSAKVVQDDYALNDNEYDTSLNPIYQYNIPGTGWTWNEENAIFVPPVPDQSGNWDLQGLSWVQDIPSPEPEGENPTRIEIPGPPLEPGIPGDGLED